MYDILKIFNILNSHTFFIPKNASEKLYISYGALKIVDQFFRRIVGSLMYLMHIKQGISFLMV